jgi:hypothetical protein
MPLLDHPDAQALLADAVVTPEQVRGCRDRLTAFLQRYLPRFYRIEQRANAALVSGGLVSGLERKTCEPIAKSATTGRAGGMRKAPGRGHELTRGGAERLSVLPAGWLPFARTTEGPLTC